LFSGIIHKSGYHKYFKKNVNLQCEIKVYNLEIAGLAFIFSEAIAKSAIAAVLGFSQKQEPER